MEMLETIRTRRAVRDYQDRRIDRTVLTALIDAACQAPSAINQQPWAFAVVEDRRFLEEISGEAKAYWRATLADDGSWDQLRTLVENPDFNLFYNATTLIIIYARPEGLNPAEDCCLAAENLMLAACAMGLGTCPIGLARPWLGREEVKEAMGVPESYTPVFPVIVGYPQGETAPVPRRAPEIIFWKAP